MKIKSPKKLIEVNLPLKEINEAAAREKNNPFIKGHPKKIHMWWAPRPLTAARAMIFAQMVNDPGGARGWAKGLTKEEAAAKREQLFDIIRDLVKWENTNNEEVLERARAAIRESWRETCALNAGQPGFDPEKLPAFHDPFAGGGAIPLEAQRLGLESYASDLNPVAVMINKAMIEIPPKFANRVPVGPLPPGVTQEDLPVGADHRAARDRWPGAAGLAEDVRRYGAWMREEAKKKIGHLYPPVEITAEMARNRPDLKPYIGQKLTVIAWLWARTVKSPNPAFSDVDVPLVSSFILSSKRGKEAYVEPVIDGHSWRFEVRMGTPSAAAAMGTKLGRGAKFKCLMSGAPMEEEYVRGEGVRHRMGARLMAIVAEGTRGRVYLSPTELHETTAQGAQPSWRPTTPMADNPRWFSPPAYGMTTYGDIFTDRQLVALNTFSDLVAEAREKAIQDARTAGWDDDGSRLADGGTGATAYGDALAVYLTFGISQFTRYCVTFATWNNTNQNIAQGFSRQAIPMTWDFPETNAIEGALHIGVAIGWVVEALSAGHFARGAGTVKQLDAQTQEMTQDKVISTDPPYYDNIGYADLSDYFYVWLRKGLQQEYPQLFATMSTPKAEELVATPYRHGGKENAEKFFLDGMTDAMRNLVERANPAFPVTIYYAFRQNDTDEEGTSNAGWETFLGALVRAGFVICGTWPLRTEKTVGLKGDVNTLASSIVLVCRKRGEDAPVTTRQRFLRELREEMHEALMDMTSGDAEHAPIAPVDLQQAAIGPGMGVYSKYREITKMDGSRMTVHEAMLEIMKEIDAYLNPDTALKDVDSSTRFFVEWYKLHGFDDGPFGEAQTLATAKGITVQHVVDSEVAVSGGGKVRILNWEEYPVDPDYDPREDDNLPLWEACHRVLRELKQGSERTAATLLAKMPDNLANGIYHLTYYLYDWCTKQGDAAGARVYNELATSWEDILRIKNDILMSTQPKERQMEMELH